MLTFPHMGNYSHSGNYRHLGGASRKKSIKISINIIITRNVPKVIKF